MPMQELFLVASLRVFETCCLKIKIKKNRKPGDVARKPARQHRAEVRAHPVASLAPTRWYSGAG
jgi:hypothetical protein